MPLIRMPVPLNKNRSLQDLNFEESLTYGQVASVWGRPDDFGGFGIDYFIYKLNNGNWVWLEFGPKNVLVRAILFDPRTLQRVRIR